LVLPGSPASSSGFHQSLALVFPKCNTRDKESNGQKNNVISINQSIVLYTTSEQQIACNNFVI
jgi:hypothetical protein